MNPFTCSILLVTMLLGTCWGSQSCDTSCMWRCHPTQRIMAWQKAWCQWSLWHLNTHGHCDALHTFMHSPARFFSNTVSICCFELPINTHRPFWSCSSVAVGYLIVQSPACPMSSPAQKSWGTAINTVKRSQIEPGNETKSFFKYDPSSTPETIQDFWTIHQW